MPEQGKFRKAIDWMGYNFAPLFFRAEEMANLPPEQRRTQAVGSAFDLAIPLSFKVNSLKPGTFIRFLDKEGNVMAGKIRDVDWAKKEAWVFPENRELADPVTRTIHVPIDDLMPIKRNPVFAFKMKNGKIIEGQELKPGVHHADEAERLGLNFDDVMETGFLDELGEWTNPGEIKGILR